MGYTLCKIKNIDSESHSYEGQLLNPNDEYQITDNERIRFSTCNILLEDIAAGKAQIGDGSSWFSDTSTQYRWLLVDNPTDSDGHLVYHYPAFAEKKLFDGSKLYKRLHGKVESLSSGSNNVIFTCPHGYVKIIGTRIVGAEIGDYCDFYVLDDTSGTYSGTPNAVLNQYGFNVAIAPDDHQETCRYDADLYYGMQIKFVYNSVSAKTVGFNFDMSEVVAPT